MKYTLLSLVLISTQLSGMITTNVSTHKDDDFYKYVYKKEIVRSLPLDVCNHIDHLYALLRNKTIRESLIKTTGMQGYKKLFISNNGHYYAYANDYNIELRDIEQSNIIGTFSSRTKKTPIYFSPSNDYCVIKSGASPGIRQTTYLYNFIQSQKHIITPKEHYYCSGITISHDSKYVVYKDKNGGIISKYTPWILDDQGTPQEITLKNNYFTSSRAVIFHPDSKHIIHNKYQGELYLYNLETGENKIIFHAKNSNTDHIDKLTLISDNKKIIAETRFKSDFSYDPHHYILFNIENLDNVTSVAIPQQSCDTKKQLPVMAIPYKNIITHIGDCGRTLQLLDDKTLQCITTHTTQEGVYITALAVDNSGNYLAVGYSDGTIMIWHLFSSDPAKYEKTCMQTKNGFIKSLTFSENQLLLSQSQSCDFFDDKEAIPTPGTAILWDIYGNEITHFGDNIVASIMSPNGKTIIITSAKLEWFDFGHLALQIPYCQRDLTLTTYHQTDENLALCSQNGPTLTQLSKLIAQANSNQMDLDAQ
jgi:WD40 repeat protein